jgi:AcrR family transcriptional regulator
MLFIMIKHAFKSSRQRGRRPISVSLGETKTLKLYQEGLYLLTQYDFEQISVSQFAKVAGMSVGAFYVRFSDKDAFLDFATLHTFLTAQQGFKRASASIVSNSQRAASLADTLVAQFASEEFAGIVRMAVKRGFSDLRHRESFDLYRSFVVDQMAEMLPNNADRNQKAELAIAIQATFGILTDAVISRVSTEPLSLSKYRDILVRLLSVPLGKTKLRKSKPAKEPTQTRIKKV